MNPSLHFGTDIRDDLVRQIRPGETSYSELVDMFGKPAARKDLPTGESVIHWTGHTEFYNFAPDHKHILDVELDAAVL